MAFLDLFKKKKSLELDIPPPPLPKPFEEIPPVRPEGLSELPEFPSIPQELPQEESPQEEIVQPLAEPEIAPVPAHVPQLREAPHQMFVSVDDYKKIMQNTNSIRAKLIETESSLAKLSELRAQEEHLVDRWSKELAEVERKLARVDHAIARAQR